MAESVAFLLKHLSELLAHEAKLLCGVEDRIRSLHNELEIINVFLKTSMANKKSKKEIEQKVVSQIRDVAHVAEDVIDTFVANVAIHKRRSMLARMLHVVDHTKSLRDIAVKIDNIKNTLNEIRENKINYDFQEISDQSTSAREEEERAQSLHRLRRNVEEEDVIGFVHESKVVIDRLMEGGSGSRHKVVSIIGMGGLGKTALARKVYNSDEVKRHFNCRAWVYVSNECRAKELLLGLLKQLMPNGECDYRRKSNKMEWILSSFLQWRYPHPWRQSLTGDFSSLSDDELKKTVRGYLEGKRYLLVLDDLWKKQDWDEVQGAFPDENKGSRILITTRLKEVISHTSRDPPYYLQFLSEEQSWELFSKKLFRGEEYPSDLDQLGRQLVRSCGGLPLSIVVLTGLLVNKEKSHREWSKVVGHVNWYLTRDETQVKDIILKLNYEDLPARLKPCFLYLGIFPEDYEIPVKRLLQQWVAEGFIQETGSRDPYDVAEDYLYELIDRSLIQVARLKSSGGVKTCRIHDLLRDLCISKGEEEKVFHVFTDNNILIPTKPRRLSIHCSMPRYVSSSTNDHSCVRSLLSFDPGYSFASNDWKWLSKSFKLARLLDIQGKCYKKIPSNLGNFIHLRYLRISLKHVRSIPDSICDLSNLETLDLGLSLRHRPPPISFPNGIWKLKHLRHVYTYGPIMLRGHCSESDREIVGNLQTISSVVLNKQMISLIEKGRFPQLRKLGLKIPPNFKGDLLKMLLGLQQLRHLNKLKIHFQINWPDFFNCKRQEVLQSLKRLSHLCALEIWHVMDLTKCVAMFPPNITKIILLGISFLDGDVMHALGSLSNLRILRLSRSSEFSYSFDLNCVGGEFPQLQLFEMKNLLVQNWKLANGAMPCLQSLVIDGCKSLDSLPSELWSLTTLRKVHVLRPSNAMTTMLQNLEVKNGCEIIVDSYWDKIPLF